MQIKAAVIESPGAPLVVTEVDLSQPGPGEVLVRMHACGICRSDLHVAATGETIWFPAVLGHEGAGVIEAVGAGTSIEPGTPVVLSWTPRCGQCPFCREGRPQLCRKLTTAPKASCFSLGGKPLATYMGLGCLAEAVVVPEACAIAVPAGLALTSLCLLGCGVTTGYGAAVHAAGVSANEKVAVFGCGAVGLSAVQGARLAGADMILAIDPNPSRRRLAEELGATDTISGDDGVSQVVQRSAGGVDAAIEATGDPAVMQSLLNAVRPGGRAVIVGLPRIDATISLSPFHFLAEKRLTGSIYGSADPRVDFPMLAERYARGELYLDELCGGQYDLMHVNEAFAELAQGRSPRPIVALETVPA